MALEPVSNRVRWRGVFILNPVTLQPVTFPSQVTIGGQPIVVDVQPGSAIGSGRQTVAAAGTGVQLTTTSTPILGVIIKALITNTGDIYVGGAGVAAASGYPLAPGEFVGLDVDNLTDVWIDAAVNGEGVSYIYIVP